MNERIKDLLPNPFAVDYQYKDGPLDLYTEKEMIRFAELIVLECVNAVMDGTKEGDHYAMRIENHFDSGTGGVLHFGVEE